PQARDRRDPGPARHGVRRDRVRAAVPVHRPVRHRPPPDPSGGPAAAASSGLPLQAGRLSMAVRLSTIAVPKTLFDLLGHIPAREARGGDVPVLSLAYRSVDAAPGTLSFCVPGTRAEGHDLAGDAVLRGASALRVERWLGLDVPQVLVPSVREAMGRVSAEFFGR